MENIQREEYGVPGTALPDSNRRHTRKVNLRKFAFSLATIALGCLVALSLAELTVRVFKPRRDRFYVWPPNYSATLTPMPGVMQGVGPTAHLHVNSQGIIGDEWSPERNREYRILTVGGSTTECLYLDQEKTWAAQLQSGLGRTVDGRNVWVGNVGKAGFNSRDHLAFMKLVLAQYDVDCIVMLVGGNDMIHRLMQADTYDPHFVEDEQRYREWLNSRFAVVPTSSAYGNRPFFKKTALWQMGQELLKKYRDSHAPIIQDDAGDWLVHLRKVRSEAVLTDDLPDLESGLAEYERNLTAIIEAARARSVRLVFVTQPTIWKTKMSEQEVPLLWMGWRPDGKFYSTAALKKAMDSYNEKLMKVCRKFDLSCQDLANRLPRTTEVFYDDMHFNESGARSVSNALVSILHLSSPFATDSGSKRPN